MKLTKGTITILILTGVTAVLWVFAQIYTKTASTASPQIPAGYLSPFNPTLDNRLINDLRNRQNP